MLISFVRHIYICELFKWKNIFYFFVCTNVENEKRLDQMDRQFDVTTFDLFFFCVDDNFLCTYFILLPPFALFLKKNFFFFRYQLSIHVHR